MVCTNLVSLLRPLFYFLCSILLIHRVHFLNKMAEADVLRKYRPCRGREIVFKMIFIISTSNSSLVTGGVEEQSGQRSDRVGRGGILRGVRQKTGQNKTQRAAASYVAGIEMKGLTDFTFHDEGRWGPNHNQVEWNGVEWSGVNGTKERPQGRGMRLRAGSS